MHINFKALLFTVITPLSLCAQWNNNSAVNLPLVIGQNKQVDLRMCKDGAGGAIITWKDNRTGVPDVYAQRVTGAGVLKWNINGVAICINSSDQSTPAIVPDGKGGAIITWSDWRSNIERDIYAQRIDSNGVPLWTVDGVIVAGKTAREHNPKIVSDKAGGAIITWEQQTNGIWDIWAQRIDGNGNSLWANGGIPMANFSSNKINPKIQDDGKGGAVIVWQDERSGIYDIYAQRVDKNGTLKWGATGKMICNATGVQNDPKVDPDSLTGGAYIVWIDKRNGNYDLYAQKVDSSGNILWNNSGVVVSNAAGSQTAHDIMSNQGTNGLIIVWKDKRNADYDIYAQKLNSSGSALWTANGVVVTNAVKDQLNPNIVEDNSGGAIIVWQDSSNGSFDIRAQKLNAAGIKLWTPMGEIVGNAPGDQIQPKNIPDGKGGSIFAFQDYRAGNYDIYVHHLYTNGMVTGIENTGSSVYDAKAYPNPFSESLLIDLPVAGNVNLTLYDISGKTVALTKSAYQVDLQKRTILLTPATDQMNTGLYFIRITGESGEAKVLTVNYLKR